MIPFVRIFEYNNISTNGILLDIDFSTSEIGSTEIIDTSATGAIFERIGTGEASVVSLEGYGNVMSFSTGSMYYRTEMKPELELSNKKFSMRVKFMSTSSKENHLLSTGDYFQSVIVGGLLLTLFNSTGTQMFCVNDAGSSFRSKFTYVVNTWRDITFTWNPTNKLMEIYDNDTDKLLNKYTVSHGFGDGEYFSIGGSVLRKGASNFEGYIKSIRIEQVKI